MKTTIMNRLNGYDRHFKGRFLLLHRKVLSDSEFVLWDLSFSVLAEWDRKNHASENYGSFYFQQTEIGTLLGWHKSKVCRNSEKLFAVGLWAKRNGRVFVNGFDIRDSFAEIARNNKVIDLQKQVAILQPGIANSQPSIAVPQHKSSKGGGVISPKSVAILQQSSIKADLVSFKSEFNVLRADEDYQRMWEENPNGLSIEDMKWIDQNIKEYAHL